MEIGKILKNELRNRGLRFNFVAEKTGIPYNSLKRYLNNVFLIPESKLRCVCLTFDIDPKIFGLSDSKKIQNNRKEGV